MASLPASRVARYGHCPSVLLSAPAVLPAPAVATLAARSALHVRAGLDVRALSLLPDVHRFVMVDSRPFGIDTADPVFLPRLHEGMYRAGFSSTSSSSTPALLAHIHGSAGIHRFRSSEGRVVEYHYNTCIPEDDMHPLLPRCDTLIVTDHDPHVSVVTRACISHGIHFVGFYDTSHAYVCAQENDVLAETTIARLHVDKEYQNRFASFAFVNEHSDVTKVDTWHDFQALVSGATLRGAST